MRIGGFAGRVLPSSASCRSSSPAATSIRRWRRARIDAAEWVGPYDDEKLGFHKVAQYYYYPGWWEGGPMLHNFINIAKWNSLPKNYQSIVQSGLARRQHHDDGEVRRGNPAALKRLIAGGAQLRAFPPPVLDAAFKAANELYAEISASNADFKKVYDACVAFRGDQYLWWQVAEYGFDTYMIRARTRT